ncbi:MAG: DUF177 domain-containing protein [Pseudolabrys sp.]|nr:DUF177 domain-containing protein [Pseudolabrys sp.]
MDKKATPSYGNVWSVPVNVDDIPDSGLHMKIEATAEIRAAVAKLASVRDMPHLAASFDLSRQGAAVHITGQVDARVGQSCVVTLEPLETTVAEPVDVTFAPAAAIAPVPGDHERTLSEPEPPEPLVGGRVDLGALATEFAILGIDPYPRKPDAAFAAPKAGDGPPKPFAALAALKKPPASGPA